jgi:hypothetical protein
MDTELARTFLTVVTAGNFISAADQLHVSQSTVSTRIHTLEDQLVPRHSDYDWLILSQFRMGRSFGATRIWMLRATPG